MILDQEVEETRARRNAVIADYYEARCATAAGRFSQVDPAYNPVPPETLFLDDAAWTAALASRLMAVLSPFTAPDDALRVFDAGGRPGIDFAEARSRPDVNVFDALAARIGEHRRRPAGPARCREPRLAGPAGDRAA